MCLLVVKYSGLFRNLKSAALITAFILFILYLLLFLTICFSYTCIPIEYGFIKKFERYLVLAIGIYMIIPFALSSILIFALLTEHIICMKIWLRVFTAVTTIYTLVVLGASIYSLVEGTLHIGLTALIATSILAITNTHGIMIVYSLYKQCILHSLREHNSNQIRKVYTISKGQERYTNNTYSDLRQRDLDLEPREPTNDKSNLDEGLTNKDSDTVEMSSISKNETSTKLTRVDSVYGVELRSK